ncbi:MAG TPA: nucleotidyltransferase family protein [Candidatus Bathyarchaeia archaeon]|nr:nucleotidyltransferase family protein [Candidatus Bathyarchaeia archaeon]
MRPFVAGLVLAAGASTRLGQPKQLLPFGGTTMLGRVLAETCGAAALDQVVAVIGGSAAEVRRQVDFGRATVVENPEFGEGCASSYRTGLAVLDPRAEAVAVVLGDQPGVDRTVIDLMADAWRGSRSVITLASYRQRLGHPMIFDRSLFPALGALQGDKAAWKIVDAHPEWVREVTLDRPYPFDVNTWEEYEALLQNAGPSPDRRPR